MSATTSPQTFADLYTDLQNRVRDQTGVAATQNIAKRYTNTALVDIHLGFAEKLPWAERASTIVTNPSYTTGTVTIATGSTSITGTGTLWNTNNSYNVKNVRVGGKFVFSGTSDVYEVTAVGSDTTATITPIYIGAALTDASYVYFEDEYSLADDFLRPFDYRTFSPSLNIELIGRSEFKRRFPRNNTIGQIVCATLEDKPPAGNVTPVRKVRFYRPPSTVLLVPYSYVTKYLVVSSSGVAQESFSADTDEPIVPRRYRHCIVLHALTSWYRDLKDDTRSQEAANAYRDTLLRMVSDTEIGESRPQFRPRVGPYMARARRPWRGGSGRYDINGRFDRMED